MNDDAVFVALLREGAMSAQMLGTGVTALRRATTSAPGQFSLSFFCLSIGIERASKIALVLDHWLRNREKFPTDAELRKYGHDIEQLFGAVVAMMEMRKGAGPAVPVPGAPIHRAILATLSEFGKATRYHNLDLLVQGKGAALKSPEVAWFERVGSLVLQAHHRPSRSKRDAARAEAWQAMLGSKVAIANLGPNAKFIRSIGEQMAHAQRTKLIQRHAQFYTLQILRFLTEALWTVELDAHKQQKSQVPHFSELFAPYFNDDAYFRSRKTWDGPS